VIGPELTDGKIRLIAPDVERDSPLSLVWTNGPEGNATMRLMGNPPETIQEMSLKDARELSQKFIDQTNEINWTVDYDSKIIGAVWIHLEDDEYIKGPSLSFMIGDRDMRRKGIGVKVANLVTAWAKSDGSNLNSPLQMRALISNTGSRALIARLGAHEAGPKYADKHGLEWQNYSL
jgi:RimJ/RimL family protein N-acetyltransferase